MDMILKEIPGNWVRYKYAYNQFGIRCMCAIVANKFFDNPFLGFDENTDFNIDPYFIGYFALGMHNFAIAYWLLQNAKETVNEAHHAQTELIQAEIRGEKAPLNLLMVHAQDHLMTALVVIDLAQEFIDLYKKIK